MCLTGNGGGLEYAYITECRVEETDFWSDVLFSDTLSATVRLVRTCFPCLDVA